MAEEIKVTDKRMFTPEGELRDEYRHLEQESNEAAQGATKIVEEASSGADGPAVASEQRRAAPQEHLPEARFLDLVAMLAEPVAYFLGDAEAPDGTRTENLPVARLHIDMLEVLRQKTAGNLAPEENKALEAVIYQLRLRYVDKTR